MQHDTYVTATLSISTRYYCDVHVIYITSSTSMLSSLSYDNYKPNTPSQRSSISQESTRTWYATFTCEDYPGLELLGRIPVGMRDSSKRKNWNIIKGTVFTRTKQKSCLLNPSWHQYTLNTKSDKKTRGTYWKNSDYFNGYRPSNLY